MTPSIKSLDWLNKMIGLWYVWIQYGASHIAGSKRVFQGKSVKMLYD